MCGSAAELVENRGGNYFVRCSDKYCAVRTRQYHENSNGAVSSWNRRVGDE